MATFPSAGGTSVAIRGASGEVHKSTGPPTSSFRVNQPMRNHYTATNTNAIPAQLSDPAADYRNVSSEVVAFPVNREQLGKRRCRACRNGVSNGEHIYGKSHHFGKHKTDGGGGQDIGDLGSKTKIYNYKESSEFRTADDEHHRDFQR